MERKKAMCGCGEEEQGLARLDTNLFFFSYFG